MERNYRVLFKALFIEMLKAHPNDAVKLWKKYVPDLEPLSEFEQVRGATTTLSRAGLCRRGSMGYEYGPLKKKPGRKPKA